MNNTKCIKLNESKFNKLKDEFREYLHVSDIQTYFPILSHFFKFYNDSDSDFILNSKF